MRCLKLRKMCILSDLNDVCCEAVYPYYINEMFRKKAKRSNQADTPDYSELL